MKKLLTVLSILFLIVGCAKAPVEEVTPEVTPPQITESEVEIPETEVDGSELISYFVNVGQGDGQVFIYNGKAVVIDTGTASGSKDIISLLQSEGIADIELLVATHPHADHIGGMDKVIDKFNVKKIALPDVTEKDSPTTKTYERLLDSIIRNDVPAVAPIQGDVLYEDGQFSVTALNGNESGVSTGDLNDYSIGTLITHGDIKMMLTGDAHVNTEKQILSSGMNIKSHIMTAGHHGSSTSMAQAFLDAVNPELIILSYAEGNSYGHPHRETTDKINAGGYNSLNTSDSGTIVIKSDGKTYSVQ